ncbi:MAG: LLM class flavin-dependent oxidoreductase [bacterium]|nr:LLM class flavin-dependent oxidoreductase [bacterium]
MLNASHERRRALLSQTAESGLDHVFVADHISFHTGFGMDGLIQAATIAAIEPRLSVHLGVYLLALRHPVPVARQIATLCESAPGRLLFGVGIGGEDRHEIEITGVDPRTRGRRTDECLIALRGLLSGGAISHRCEFFEFEDALILPAPDPAVPIVIGGRSSAALKRAGRYGDGWLAAWCSARRFREAVTEVDAEAERVGRTRTTWQHGLQVWTGIDEDRGRARERLAGEMQRMYQIPFEPFAKYSPCGTPSEIADFLAPYVEAGCSDFNVLPIAESSEVGIEAIAEVRRLLLEVAKR